MNEDTATMLVKKRDTHNGEAACIEGCNSAALAPTFEIGKSAQQPVRDCHSRKIW